MISSVDKVKGIQYTFRPDGNWVEKLELGVQTFSNDVFTQYKTTIPGKIEICSNISKIDELDKEFIIIPETYSQYLDFISQRDFNKEQWVYNILDGVAEQDRILYKDEIIVVVPNYTWDLVDLKKIHLLVFPTDKSLHSIRDLTVQHVELLKHIKTQTLQVIKSVYGFDSKHIKMYIHYSPSTYHLHVHFVLISNNDANSSVEYSHELNNVINILEAKSDFYQSVVMNKRI